jgi:hypothetical protein
LAIVSRLNPKTRAASRRLFPSPPGYVRSKAPERPKLGLLVPVIDAILESDGTAEAAAHREADFRTAANTVLPAVIP